MRTPIASKPFRSASSKALDYLNTGKVHQVDTEMLRVLLDKGIIPVIPPLGFDGNGHPYRLNSDAVVMLKSRARSAR